MSLNEMKVKHREALNLIHQGYSFKTIADQLGLKLTTIEFLSKSILVPQGV